MIGYTTLRDMTWNTPKPGSPVASVGGFMRLDGLVGGVGVCEAMDLDPAPNNINNVRLKLKRLTGRSILAETEPGLFTQPRP
jgi:hypothetical protein